MGRKKNSKFRSIKEVIGKDRVKERSGFVHDRKRWTTSECRQLAEMYIFENQSQNAIEDALHRSKKSVEGKLQTLYRGEWQLPPAKYNRTGMGYSPREAYYIHRIMDPPGEKEKPRQNHPADWFAAGLGRTVSGIITWKQERDQPRKRGTLTEGFGLDQAEVLMLADYQESADWKVGLTDDDLRAALLDSFDDTISTFDRDDLCLLLDHWYQIMGMISDRLQSFYEIERLIVR